MKFLGVYLILATCSVVASAAPDNEDQRHIRGRDLKRLNYKAITRCLPDFSDTIVFGDGLSDNGNLKSVEPGMPGRASNGPVAVEYLSQKLGIAQASSLHLTMAHHPPGNNYAVTGARSAPKDSPPARLQDNKLLRVPVQVDAFLGRSHGRPVAPDDALYVFFAGRDDVCDAVEDVIGGKLSLHEAREGLRDASAVLAESMRSVIGAGAKYVLHVGVPNLGETPRFTVPGWGPLRKLAARLTEDFNVFMADAIADLECDTGVAVAQADVFDFADAATDAGLQIDEPCIISPYYSNGLPEAHIPRPDSVVPFKKCDISMAKGYAFWDELNPTTHAHKVLADFILASFGKQACQKNFLRKNKKSCKRKKTS